MKILIDDLTSEPLKVDRELPPDIYGKELDLLEKVRISLEVLKSGSGARIAGTVKTLARLECSRCLEKFSYSIDAEHIIEYKPASGFSGEENLRLSREDLNVILYDEPVIHLYDDVRQTVHLSIPFKPVCGEGCMGLCPGCGRNLNVEDCGCGGRGVDPRLEKLKQLLE